jgi:hypothetical protein
MRNVLIALFLLSTSFGASSDANVSSTFESSYNQLEKKVADLKAKGDKIDDQTRKEIDNLLMQMNHEHTQLKRELELKNQQLTQKVNEGVKVEQDWSQRISSAFHEVGGGFTRAWERLKKGAN